jgi:hypothetical protein
MRKRISEKDLLKLQEMINQEVERRTKNDYENTTNVKQI